MLRKIAFKIPADTKRNDLCSLFRKLLIRL